MERYFEHKLFYYFNKITTNFFYAEKNKLSSFELLNIVLNIKFLKTKTANRGCPIKAGASESFFRNFGLLRSRRN